MNRSSKTHSRPRHLCAAAAIFFCITLPMTSIAAPQKTFHVPTATEFVDQAPENAFVKSSRTVHGKAAVQGLTKALKIHLSAMPTQSSPFNEGSSDVIATYTKQGNMALHKAMSGLNSDTTNTLGPVQGDTVTYTWTEDGWHYSVTFTFDGTDWQVTAFSATKAHTV